MRLSCLRTILLTFAALAVFAGCSVRNNDNGKPDATADVLPDAPAPDTADLASDSVVPDGTPMDGDSAQEDLLEDIQGSDTDVTEEDLLPDLADPDVATPPQPIPAGTMIELTIAETGGSFLLPGSVWVEFKADSLPEGLVIEAVQIDAPDDTSIEATGAFYEFGPAGLQFDEMPIITFPFDATKVSQDEPTLIGRRANGDWYAISVERDWNSGLARATLPHFSPWGIGILKNLCSTDADCDWQPACESAKAYSKEVCEKNKCVTKVAKCPSERPICGEGACLKTCETGLDCLGKSKPMCLGDLVVVEKCLALERPFLKAVKACLPEVKQDCAGIKQDCVSGHCVGACVPNCIGKECGPSGCPNGTCGACDSWEGCVNGLCQPTPQCGGKQCGPDGIGGVCGQCANGQTCTNGKCCTPNCQGKSCGSDGCGGSCGSCPMVNSPLGNLNVCVQGQCKCQPWCESTFGVPWVGSLFNAPECGPDLCGGQCNGCVGSEVCVDGLCEICVPDCTGRKCGPNGCNGSCGSCQAGEYCSAGQCLTAGCGNGTCELAYEDYCSCPQDCNSLFEQMMGFESCGCEPTGAPINPEFLPEGFKLCWAVDNGFNRCTLCPLADYCTLDGLCLPDNGCGNLQCGFSPTTGALCGTCSPEEECILGVCESICIPQCDGKECGWDGCQGYCGLGCAAGEFCNDGQCETFACSGCDQADCGWDSCQNSCGACPGGEHCNWQTRQCVPNCVPNCGDRLCGSNGCGGQCGICEPGFRCNENMGTCQPCLPECFEQQECGSDGCGGFCGICGPGYECVQDFYCEEVCIPNCQGRECGSDGCGGICGDPAPNGHCGDGSMCLDGICDCMHDSMCAESGCGSEDLCGNLCECPQGQICMNGQCQVCTPQCAGSAPCGEDGCGGSCGTCLTHQICATDPQTPESGPFSCYESTCSSALTCWQQNQYSPNAAAQCGSLATGYEQTWDMLKVCVVDICSGEQDVAACAESQMEMGECMYKRLDCIMPSWMW